MRVAPRQQRVARRPVVLDLLNRMDLPVVDRRHRVRDVRHLGRRLREVHRVRRDPVVRHHHDLRRHLRRPVVHALARRQPRGTQPAPVDPQVVERPRQVEAFFRVADHQDDRDLGVHQLHLRDLRHVPHRLVLRQLRQLPAVRLHAEHRAVDAVVADVRLAHQLRQPPLRRRPVFPLPQRHLQVQVLVQGPRLLDEPRLPDQRVDLVRRVIRPHRLHVRQSCQPIQILPVHLHQQPAVRHHPEDAADLTDLRGDPVVPQALQIRLADLNNVDSLLPAPLAVAADPRSGRTELGRDALQGVVLLQIDVADVGGNEPARVARLGRLEPLAERRQPLGTLGPAQPRMGAIPSLDAHLVHLHLRALGLWLAMTAVTARPVECSRRNQQQGKHHARDQHATERPEIGTSAHHDLPKWEEAPGRSSRRLFIDKDF